MAQLFRSGFASIVGRPNAGKSSLLNALVGEKVAITAPQAQTTRTTLQGVLTTDRAQIVFVDTPGIHKSDTLFNRHMMETVRTALAGRDLVLFVVDATRKPGIEDEHAVSALDRKTPALLILNKIDELSDKRTLLPLIEHYSALFPFAAAMPVSARTKEGVEELKRNILDRMPEGARLYPNDYLTDQPVRFMAAEIIREQILRHTHDEVPHASAILIDSWEEKNKLKRIAATIHVERPGQKTILIGKEGAGLKKIGTAARLELERLTGGKVFLSLFVKVKPKWREDPSFLNNIDWRAMIGTDHTE